MRHKTNNYQNRLTFAKVTNKFTVIFVDHRVFIGQSVKYGSPFRNILHLENECAV